MSNVNPHLVDGAKATPVLGFITAWLAGISISEWAALATLVYTCLLLYDKLRQMGVFRWLKARLRPKGGVA